ncbi:MAG: hypothetical protein DRO43_06115 [Candidatus Hecatellales archaeon]|nr:MAG: hypothetical protein DRO43_06115 [Candidatus Hecatellales archaeon]
MRKHAKQLVQAKPRHGRGAVALKKASIKRIILAFKVFIWLIMVDIAIVYWHFCVIIRCGIKLLPTKIKQ